MYTRLFPRAQTKLSQRTNTKEKGQTENNTKAKEHLHSPGRLLHPHRTRRQNVGANDVTSIVGAVESIIRLELRITVNEDRDKDRSVNRIPPGRC